MFDDIRETISDYLIYILIGLGALVLLFLIILGIRLVSGGSSSAKKQAATQSAEADTGDNTTDPSSIETLTACTDEEIVQLIQTYYQALAAQDTETIKVHVDELTAEDEEAIQAAQDIEAYNNLTIYAVSGLKANTWVVYTTYTCKYKNFTSEVPKMSQLYVCTADDGSYYISDGSVEESVKEYIDKLNESPAVSELETTTQTSYDQVLSSDTSLSAYLQNGSSSATNALYQPDGATLTVATDCNVRQGASTSSEKLGRLSAGDTVIKEGSEAEWIQITFEGQTAYVRWDMFQ